MLLVVPELNFVQSRVWCWRLVIRTSSGLLLVQLRKGGRTRSQLHPPGAHGGMSQFSICPILTKRFLNTMLMSMASQERKL